jgi:hypothetical protein
MNTDFLRIIAAKSDDRRNLFLTTANRLGTPIQNVEKDFWVSWVLDLLFNGRTEGEPRLLFKGGTSLSKAYGLISRFSEDIDITVFREDLGKDISVKELDSLSRNQKDKHLRAIKVSCQIYIGGELKERLNRQIKAALIEAGISPEDIYLENDPDDSDKQTLLLHYPSVNVETDFYVRPVVKIEAGAKSALDPHCKTAIKPYLDDELSDLSLAVENVVTIDAERTFWDKVIILHGQRCWFDNKGALRQQGHRVSRHYYDIYQLMHSPVMEKAIKNNHLAIDCAHHAQLFFNSPDLDLKQAIPGSLTITPTINMAEILKRDYQAMSGMIFGEIPKFSDVLESISNLERKLNRV